MILLGSGSARLALAGRNERKRGFVRAFLRQRAWTAAVRLARTALSPENGPKPTSPRAIKNRRAVRGPTEPVELRNHAAKTVCALSFLCENWVMRRKTRRVYKPFCRFRAAEVQQQEQPASFSSIPEQQPAPQQPSVASVVSFDALADSFPRECVAFGFTSSPLPITARWIKTLAPKRLFEAFKSEKKLKEGAELKKKESES